MKGRFHNIYPVIEHGNRVAQLGKALLKYMGASSKELSVFYNAALLHDIGKYYIDEKILNKPNKLDKKEFKSIQKHCEYGYSILKQNGIGNEILEAILYHHENYNGTGYPTGLKGRDIPLYARIIRVCDTFDALVSDRVYCVGKSYNSALKIMEGEKEKYDPFIFCVFKEIVYKEVEFIYNKEVLH
jgi:putative nucleotidyltransferase with HDIG domain